MQELISRTIKSNPTFFRLWYHLYRKNRGVPIDFFSSETKLYIDGYPRSGNTFSLFLSKKVWPDLRLAHHFHAVAAIKISLELNIPTFILVRDPAQAISSWYLKHFSFNQESRLPNVTDIDLLEKFLNQYVSYYKFVLSVSDRLRIIRFEDLISNPVGIMKCINDRLDEEDRRESDELLLVVNRNAQKKFGARDELGSSTPSAHKEKLKKSLIDELAVLPNIGSANRLFARLTAQ